MECSLFNTNIIYPFVLVSVLASKNACTVWYEPSLLGLSSVKCSRIIGKFIKKSASIFLFFLQSSSARFCQLFCSSGCFCQNARINIRCSKYCLCAIWEVNIIYVWCNVLVRMRVCAVSYGSSLHTYMKNSGVKTSIEFSGISHSFQLDQSITVLD